MGKMVCKHINTNKAPTIWRHENRKGESFIRRLQRDVYRSLCKSKSGCDITCDCISSFQFH